MKVTQSESGNNERMLRGMLTCSTDVQGLIKIQVFFLTTIWENKHTHTPARGGITISVRTLLYIDFCSFSVLLYSLTQTPAPDLNSYLASKVFTLKWNELNDKVCVEEPKCPHKWGFSALQLPLRRTRARDQGTGWSQHSPSQAAFGTYAIYLCCSAVSANRDLNRLFFFHYITS